MRVLTGLFLSLLLVLTGSMIPRPSLAATSPRVSSKSNLLAALKDWEGSLNERAMDAFERDLEREFILRLRFQVERRYTGDDASLVRILAFLLELEEQPQNLSLSYTTSYLRELLEAVHTIREPNENLARFIRQFTEASGIKNVMSANQFLSSRAYLNGLETARARDMDDDRWNEIAARVTTFSEEDAAPPAPAVEAPEDTVQLLGPGMPDAPAPSEDASESATENLTENLATDALDPELLAELQNAEAESPTAPTPNLDEIIGSPPPPAPRIQSIRSTDESATLR